MTQPLNPDNVICIIKHEGREVGRIAATARNKDDYIRSLQETHKSLTIDFVEDADAAMIGRMLSFTQLGNRRP